MEAYLGRKNLVKGKQEILDEEERENEGTVLRFSLSNSPSLLNFGGFTDLTKISMTIPELSASHTERPPELQTREGQRVLSWAKNLRDAESS